MKTKTLNMRLGSRLGMLRLWWLAKRGYTVSQVVQRQPDNWRLVTVHLEKTRPGYWWEWL